jgi:hypothetical protein
MILLRVNPKILNFRSKHQTLGAKVTLGTKTLTIFSNKSATFGIKVQI